MFTAVSKHTAKKKKWIIHPDMLKIWFGGVLHKVYTTIYLLYISTSGFHNLWGGILKSFTPPYSDEFHRKFMSFHSLKKRRLKVLLIGVESFASKSAG